jgi:hypothetical protein
LWAGGAGTSLSCVMPSSAASSHVLRKTPKHVRHMANRKTGLGGITRQASSRFELFVPRRQDESLREWLQRNQEASLVSRIVGAALVLLSVYQAFSHVILNWKRIQSVKTEWIIGASAALLSGRWQD